MSRNVAPLRRPRRPVRSTVALGVPVLIVLPALLSACAPAADTISVSTTTTRAAAISLTGASLTGNAYVFVPKATGITSVSFFLDGGIRPVRVEPTAPFDLAGTTSSGAALPYDTGRLTAGSHRISVRIFRGTSVTSVTSYFSVTPAQTPTSSPSIPSFTTTAGRPWQPGSPFNTPLPSNAVLDPNSAAVANYLGGGTRQQIANIYHYGWPVFNADAGTPRVTVTARMNWGTNPFAGMAVPMPTGVAPNAGSDGHAAVIDWTTGRVYEFWQLQKVDATHWTVSWGQITPNVFTGIGNERIGGGSSKGSGMSGLAGLVRTREIRAGVIDHALEFASDGVTPNVFRFPANKTDGTNMASLPAAATIAEGTRVRLDPSINLAAIPGISPGELAVGRALQTYGAFCSDQAGARMAFGFENPANDPVGDPYPAAGFDWDYYYMAHIPWNKLQVLRQADGR